MTINNYKFNQDDVVEFDNYFGISGVGKVVGVASVSAVITGTTYIVEVLSNTGMGTVPSDIYPFSCITCPEIGMRLIDTDPV